jgi:hypothetical protein
MGAASADRVTDVQALAPTWRQPQHAGFAHALGALGERPTRCETELARAWPPPDPPLPGRLQRLPRRLGQPRLAERALARRWGKRSAPCSADAPTLAAGRPLWPVLGETPSCAPFACLLASVPCGSRGLPSALTPYPRSPRLPSGLRRFAVRGWLR